MSVSEWAILVLGACVGYLSMAFISRLRAYTLAGFTGFLAAIFSGVALTFVTDNIEMAGGEADDVWLYPIGFGAGLVIWTVVRITTQFIWAGDQFGNRLLGVAPRPEEDDRGR